MLINLYEERVKADGMGERGAKVAEIECKGDGTPGEVRYFPESSEFWQVEDKSHLIYGKGLKILDDEEKVLLIKLFNKPFEIVTGGGITDEGIHHTEAKTGPPWDMETVKYVAEYVIPAWFGTISAEVVEESITHD